MFKLSKRIVLNPTIANQPVETSVPQPFSRFPALMFRLLAGTTCLKVSLGSSCNDKVQQQMRGTVCCTVSQQFS